MSCKSALDCQILCKQEKSYVHLGGCWNHRSNQKDNLRKPCAKGPSPHREGIQGTNHGFYNLHEIAVILSISDSRTAFVISCNAAPNPAFCIWPRRLLSDAGMAPPSSNMLSAPRTQHPDVTEYIALAIGTYTWLCAESNASYLADAPKRFVKRVRAFWGQSL